VAIRTLIQLRSCVVWIRHAVTINQRNGTVTVGSVAGRRHGSSNGLLVQRCSGIGRFMTNGCVGDGMGRRPTLPRPVYEQAEEIQDEFEYPTVGEAVRHVFQEAGYDV